MNPRCVALIARLADGALHSGAELAAGLGVGRAAVWKQVGELRALGIPVESESRRGYRLERPVELLDARAMEVAYSRACPAVPVDLAVVFETGSTNEDLYASPPPPPGRARVLYAEWQHAGRGRRGRRWIAPFGSGLTFSLAWTYAETPADLPALGLAVGIAVAEALERLGANGVRIKWPNDLVVDDRKLGGLLLQLKSEGGGPACIVVGLGLNVDLPPRALAGLGEAGGLAATDLCTTLGVAEVRRNELAGTLAGAVAACLAEFGRTGFAACVERWRRLDALDGRRVAVMQGDGRVEGTACGVDADGALRIDVAGRIERYYSGDVSLRPVA
ncbi:MAG: biotin--[acetyl-CoA-carboxylase] ligase [Lysobacterales bacterium]|nr:MAG: biotin--[acetyl-CoA-carboxylase] ligase [Xanthomonadales bacterium]